MAVDLRHGGNREAVADQLGCHPAQLLDASASLVPWSPRLSLSSRALIRDYPDRRYQALRQVIAAVHELDHAHVLPGNGAAELFTWAARDAATVGLNVLPTPGFADYARALGCWQGQSRSHQLPLTWDTAFPQPYPIPPMGEVLWICNPHNPTGQLWSRSSLEPLLQRFGLVICDEAFLPLVPDGDSQSLIPLVRTHPNLIVIRSLTKLYGIAGLRLGYAVAQPERLRCWVSWRDPWPVNGLAEEIGQQLMRDRRRYQKWCHRVQMWTAREGIWMQQQLTKLPRITPQPSAANFLLIRSAGSLVSLREMLEQTDRILLRDCRSFQGLGACWLRIGLQSRRRNRRIIQALDNALKS